MPTPVNSSGCGASSAAGYEDYETNASVPIDSTPESCGDPSADDAAQGGTTLLVRLFDGAKTQGGQASQDAQAEGGSEGAGPGPKAPAPVPTKPGGAVLTADGSASVPLASVGVSAGLVLDSECGLGLIVSGNGGLNISKLKAGVETSLKGSLVTYEGSFEDFDNATQLAVDVGDGLAGGARLYFDDKGNAIGGGVAAGVGVGASVTETKSHSFVVWTGCD